jgi:hypothetical protein
VWLELAEGVEHVSEVRKRRRFQVADTDRQRFADSGLKLQELGLPPCARADGRHRFDRQTLHPEEPEERPLGLLAIAEVAHPPERALDEREEECGSSLDVSGFRREPARAGELLPDGREANRSGPRDTSEELLRTFLG